jgi:hypothetical protein
MNKVTNWEDAREPNRNLDNSGHRDSFFLEVSSLAPVGINYVRGRGLRLPN